MINIIKILQILETFPANTLDKALSQFKS